MLGHEQQAAESTAPHLIGCLPWPEGVWVAICESDCAAPSVPLVPANHHNLVLPLDVASRGLHYEGSLISVAQRKGPYLMHGCSLCLLPTMFRSCTSQTKNVGRILALSSLV